MRGKDHRTAAGEAGLGITPAYAGKSGADRAADTADQDHPRLCGEKKNVPEDVRSGTGSPPPMRGKVASVLQHVKFIGITPAYAGKRC